MIRRKRDPNSREAIEAVLEAIRNRTRDEWIELIKWRPEGYQDPEGEEDPWKEFLEQEESAKADRAAGEPASAAKADGEKAA